MEDKTYTVAITGANGQIGYILCGLIAKGNLLGKNRINLNLIELPDIIPKLEGLIEELKVNFTIILRILTEEYLMKL